MLQNIPKEKILEIVSQGPTLPAKIAKQIGSGGDTMLIGAILSTLASSGEVRVSTLKVGGSPLYYVPDQESKLEDFISYLNEKDKKAFKVLKEQKVLQDSELDPLMRVSLRAIKDFAKQFEYDYQGQKLLCWRFYSLSKEDALDLAKKLIVSRPVESKPEPVATSTTSMVVERPVEKPVEREKHVEVIQTSAQHTPVTQQTLETQEHAVTEHVIEHVKHEHKEHKDNKNAEKVHDKHVREHESHKKSSETKEKIPKSPKLAKVEYNFFDLILTHVTSMNLDLISKEKIKKTEYDLILKNHETNEYFYCKAKDKPTINEGDLAPALIFAQNKKMPCIFMSTGDLTKTAAILITREFSGIRFEKIVVSNGN